MLTGLNWALVWGWEQAARPRQATGCEARLWVSMPPTSISAQPALGCAGAAIHGQSFTPSPINEVSNPQVPYRLATLVLLTPARYLALLFLSFGRTCASLGSLTALYRCSGAKPPSPPIAASAEARATPCWATPQRQLPNDSRPARWSITDSIPGAIIALHAVDQRDRGRPRQHRNASYWGFTVA